MVDDRLDDRVTFRVGRRVVVALEVDARQELGVPEGDLGRRAV